jgi:hypothetical protein
MRGTPLQRLLKLDAPGDSTSVGLLGRVAAGEVCGVKERQEGKMSDCLTVLTDAADDIAEWALSK